MEYQRPSWDNYLLTQAFVVAQRSPDSQTKCGCVVVNKNHQILGQGYNGFPRGVDDTALPNTRPDKYDWMIHAEVNAILNSNCDIRDCEAYITTQPCFQCTLFMWQSGIRQITYATNGKTPTMLVNNLRYESLITRFKELTDMVIRSVDVDANFLGNVVETLAGGRYNI